MDRSTAGEPVQPSLDGTIEMWPGAPEGGWDRVLLKLSGEAFSGGGGLGVDPDVVASIARQIADVVRAGTEVAVVIGGGNYFRGAQLSERGMERARADYMGMLGTVMNCWPCKTSARRQASKRACRRRSPWASGRAACPPTGDATPRQGPGGHFERDPQPYFPPTPQPPSEPWRSVPRSS